MELIPGFAKGSIINNYAINFNYNVYTGQITSYTNGAFEIDLRLKLFNKLNNANEGCLKHLELISNPLFKQKKWEIAYIQPTIYSLYFKPRVIPLLIK